MNTTAHRATKFSVNTETGEVEMVILPMADYEALVTAAELAEDIAAIEAAAGDELWPADVVDRLLDGDNPVRVYREHRKLTQATLAEAADLHQAAISQIENGERVGTVDALQRLAKALGVDLEDLVPRASD